VTRRPLNCGSQAREQREVREALKQLSLYKAWRIYIASPMRIEDGDSNGIVEQIEAKEFRKVLEPDRTVTAINLRRQLPDQRPIITTPCDPSLGPVAKHCPPERVNALQPPKLGSRPKKKTRESADGESVSSSRSGYSRSYLQVMF
jgi:hypothetical protein